MPWMLLALLAVGCAEGVDDTGAPDRTPIVLEDYCDPDTWRDATWDIRCPRECSGCWIYLGPDDCQTVPGVWDAKAARECIAAMEDALFQGVCPGSGGRRLAACDDACIEGTERSECIPEE